MIKANVILDNPIWRKKLRNPSNYFRKKLKKLSQINSFRNKNQEFTILLTDNKTIKKLNYKFRKKNKITDVISFPFNNIFKGNSYIGDIAISFEIINKRSIKSNFIKELDKIWIHGYFHLLGYDHQKLKDYKIMNKKENSILNHFQKLS